jgi:hypothetical protein
MVVVLEKTAFGVTILPPAKLPREWVNECARFADDEFSRSSTSARQRAEKK